MLFKSFVIAAISLGASVMGAPNILDRPCGFKIAPCPFGSVCVATSPYCTDLNRCLGTCKPKWLPVQTSTTSLTKPTATPTRTYPSCGGFRPSPVPCPDDSFCADDPRKPSGCGMACDMPGICIPKKAPKCGGFAGIPCPSGFQCFDYPNDGCDPRQGGADCIGVCL